MMVGGGKGVSINRDEDTYNALLTVHSMTGRTISNGANYDILDLTSHSGKCRSTVNDYSTRRSNNKYTDVQTDPIYYRNKRVDGSTPHHRGRFVLAEGPRCLLWSS